MHLMLHEIFTFFNSTMINKSQQTNAESNLVIVIEYLFDRLPVAVLFVVETFQKELLAMLCSGRMTLTEMVEKCASHVKGLLVNYEPKTQEAQCNFKICIQSKNGLNTHALMSSILPKSAPMFSGYFTWVYYAIMLFK